MTNKLYFQSPCSLNLFCMLAAESQWNVLQWSNFEVFHLCLCSSEDSTDVGEEDSFLGQTSGNGPAASSTFSYFTSPVTTSDPFASIVQSPCPPPAASTATGPVSLPTNVSMAPLPPSSGSQMNPAAPSVFGSAVYQSPVGRHTPPPGTVTPPPPQMQSQSHNPYRHTPTSSRASPYIPAPEILPPPHTPQQNPYSLSSPPQMFPPSAPTFTQVDKTGCQISLVCPVSDKLIRMNKSMFRMIKKHSNFLSSASSHTYSRASTSSHHCWSLSPCRSNDAVQLQCLWSSSASLVLLQASWVKERLASLQYHWFSSAWGDIQLRYDDTAHCNLGMFSSIDASHLCKILSALWSCLVV